MSRFSLKLALALMSLWMGVGPGVGIAPALAAEETLSAAPEEIARFVATLRREAAKEKLPLESFDKALAGFKPNPKVLKAMNAQPEQEKSASAYLQLFLTPRRILDAEKALKDHHTLLVDVEARFGVSRHLLVAIWGVESSFGTIQGRYNIAHALATALFAKKREKFARDQLFALIRLAKAGDIKLPAKGSWAGAMGPMQFIPATYESYAVDYDGDGRRNLFQRGDALASAAHYLARSGWQPWRQWGLEVILPSGFDLSQTGFDKMVSFDKWAASGIRLMGGLPPAGRERAALFLPAGFRGPAFLVTTNFLSLMEYNRSPLYALAASQLATHLEGGQSIGAPWPGEQRRDLNAAERREIQARLDRAGFDPGPVDGIIGPQTRAALRDWQIAQNLPADGFPSSLILNFLRGVSPIEPQ